MEHIILRSCSTSVYVWSCDLSGIPLNKIPHNLSIICFLLNNGHITPCCNLIGWCYSGSKIIPVACQCQTNVASADQNYTKKTMFSLIENILKCEHNGRVVKYKCVYFPLILTNVTSVLIGPDSKLGWEFDLSWDSFRESQLKQNLSWDKNLRFELNLS